MTCRHVYCIREQSYKYAEGINNWPCHPSISPVKVTFNVNRSLIIDVLVKAQYFSRSQINNIANIFCKTKRWSRIGIIIKKIFYKKLKIIIIAGPFLKEFVICTITIKQIFSTVCKTFRLKIHIVLNIYSFLQFFLISFVPGSQIWLI